MKVLIEAEVVEEQGDSYRVKMETRFGEPDFWVASDKAHKLKGPSPILGMMAMKTALEAAEHDLTTHGGLIASDKPMIDAGTPVFVLDTKETVAKIDAALKTAGFRK